MAFTTAQAISIRRYLGSGNLFQNQDPRIEAAIIAVQSIADGGAQVDSTLETAIVTMLASLATLETRLEELWKRFAANSIDELRLDSVRARAALLSEGRRLVGVLSDYLVVSPRRDVFSAKPAAHEGLGGTGPWVA